ncbi:MAG: ACT domain-containing protein, partial [Bacteroidota bacterium]
VSLPQGSTVIDFAYEIHTQVGNKAIGAKIDHRLAPLTSPIKSGDQIEIITSEQGKPKREWLNLAKTVKAKAAIKSSLKAETKNRIEKGKTILEEKLAEINLKPSSRVFKKLLPAFEVSNKDELYSKIGSGIIVLEDLKKILKKKTKNKWIRYWEIQFARSSGKSKKNNHKTPGDGKYQDGPLVIEEEKENKNLTYQIAKCCNPIPGDEIIGYKNNNNIITVHKVRCPNAVKIMSSQAEHIVTTKWTMHKLFSFLVRISISGFDKFGVYNSIITIISKELNVNIRAINLSGHDGIFEGHLDLYVHDTKDLNNLIMNLMKIKGVDSVSRVEAVEE